MSLGLPNTHPMSQAFVNVEPDKILVYLDEVIVPGHALGKKCITFE